MIPQTGYSITIAEGRQIEQRCLFHAVKTVLEFGPGYSTNFFLAAGCQLTCLECDERWANQFRQFPEARQVRLFSFTDNQFPLVIPELAEAKFDLVFL